MIPVRDPDKRRHMARELSVLYRTTHPHTDAPPPSSPSVDVPMHASRSPSAPVACTGQQEAADGSGAGGGSTQTQSKGTGEQGGRRHVVSLYDAFANMGEGTVALMVEYMDGGSLQDVVDAVRCGCGGLFVAGVVSLL